MEGLKGDFIMKKGKILVTPRSLSNNGHPELLNLKDAGYDVLTPFPGEMPTENQLTDVLPDCIAYLAGVERISGKVLEKCPDLRVISRNGVGIDNVDISVVEKMKIVLKTVPGANSRGVAELTMGLMFSLVRSIPQISYSIKSGNWNRERGMEINGKTLGVIGTGMIGQQVISMGAGLGMNVLAYDLYPDTSIKKLKNVKYCSKDKLLRESDIITLHCPAGDRPLINKKIFDIIKKGSFLINTARSTLVDDKALLDSLNTGIISGYAVDVYDQEPPSMTPLFLHKQVITTAHIGGFTTESVDRATRGAVQNILSVLEKK
jgi:D-3-phosphoglycerate dehydrogenase / 2-oxoglutarate reductase